jgi:pyruvate kinase
MRRHRHAKIVATVGPASSSPEMLHGLFLAGVDTFRLNFSHGTQDDHAKVHAAIRALEREVGRLIGILQDLQGPKIRVGTIAGGRLDVAPGERVRFLLRGDEVGSYEEMTAKACHHAQDEGFAKPRDIIVTAAGIPFHAAGNTNNIRLIQISCSVINSENSNIIKSAAGFM